MSTLSQFIQTRWVPTEIARPFSFPSGTGVPMITIPTAATNFDVSRKLTRILTGACTANTYKTVLSYSGPGCLAGLVICSGTDAVSRKHSVRITLDSVVVYDSSSHASNIATAGLNIAGFIIGSFAQVGTVGAFAFQEERIFFSESLLVEYQTSLTETDKSVVGYCLYKG